MFFRGLGCQLIANRGDLRLYVTALQTVFNNRHIEKQVVQYEIILTVVDQVRANGDFGSWVVANRRFLRISKR